MGFAQTFTPIWPFAPDPQRVARTTSLREPCCPFPSDTSFLGARPDGIPAFEDGVKSKPI